MRVCGVLELLSLSTLAAGTGVGDFVALGLGLAGSATTGSDTGPASPTLSTLVSTLLGSTGTAPQSLSTGGPYTNASVDECWASWEEFWSWRHDKTEVLSSVVLTSTGSDVITYGANFSNGYTLTTTIDATRTIDNGGFEISTQVIDTTSTTTYIQSAISTSTVTSWYTYTSYSTFKDKPSNTVTRPVCKLPKEVSQCQGQWESWISTVLNNPAPTPPPGCDVGAGFLNGRTIPPCASSYSSVQGSYYTWQQSQSDKVPVCTQASIGGAQCESIRDEYVQMKANWFAPKDYATAFFFSAGYLGMFQNVSAGNMQPSYYWPTSQTLAPAPSCTLGCGRCAVTGGTVDVLYWPATETANDGPAPTGPVTLKTLGTTLTSPTVYISYSNLYASNGCSGVGTTISSTIVPIPADQTLSSVYAGTIGCDAHFRMTQVWTASASFNIADLNEPVPYSIYSSQPWCQTYLRNQNCQGTCPTDAPYKPIVVVPPDVLQALQPEWSECLGDIRGAYDPPKALQPVATAVGPSNPEPTDDRTPKPTSSTPPTPADGPGPTTPSPTHGAGPGSTSDHGPESDLDPALTDSGDGGQEQPTQNPAGIIASLLGSDRDDGNDVTPTTTQNPGGIIGSLLGGNTGAAPGGGSEPQGNTALPNSSPSSPDPQPANGPAAASPDGSSPTIVGDSGGRGNEPGQSSPGVVATIGSEAVTVVAVQNQGGASAVEVINGASTITLAPGAVATIDGTQVSVASDGNVVYDSGSERSTLTVPTQSMSDSESDAQATTTDGSAKSAATTPGVPEQTGSGMDRPSSSWWMSGLTFVAVVAMYV